MKSPRKPTPPARQLPKARVCFEIERAYHSELFNLPNKFAEAKGVTVAVLPLPAAQAKALVKAFNGGEKKLVGELVEAMHKAEGYFPESHNVCAVAVLQRLGLLGKGVGR